MAEAFWNAEVEHELRTSDVKFKFTEKTDREVFMDAVDRGRANNPYAHTNCSEESRKRGNSTLYYIVMFMEWSLYNIIILCMVIIMYRKIMIILQVVEHFGRLMATGS